MRTKIKDWFESRTGALKSGDIGIEIEVEGKRIPTDLQDKAYKLWTITGDNSLRGGYEYVLRNPVKRNDVRSAIDLLIGEFKRCDSKINDSVRAGVHVHINVQELYVVEVVNLMCLYYIFEECLVDYCGESRVGNLFCLRVKDAKYMLKCLINILQSKRMSELDSDDIRYASMNLKALRRYGSIEFRSMRTPTDLSLIELWCNILIKLRDKAVVFNNPTEVIAEAQKGLDSFASFVFEDMYDELFKGDFDVSKLKHGLYNAQDIAYCTSWVGYDKASVNPFKRDGVKL